MKLVKVSCQECLADFFFEIKDEDLTKPVREIEYLSLHDKILFLTGLCPNCHRLLYQSNLEKFKNENQN